MAYKVVAIYLSHLSVLDARQEPFGFFYVRHRTLMGLFLFKKPIYLKWYSPILIKEWKTQQEN